VKVFQAYAVVAWRIFEFLSISIKKGGFAETFDNSGRNRGSIWG
jgi:hypothetical protein